MKYVKLKKPQKIKGHNAEALGKWELNEADWKRMQKPGTESEFYKSQQSMYPTILRQCIKHGSDAGMKGVAAAIGAACANLAGGDVDQTHQNLKVMIDLILQAGDSCMTQFKDAS